MYKNKYNKMIINKMNNKKKNKNHKKNRNRKK